LATSPGLSDRQPLLVAPLSSLHGVLLLTDGGAIGWCPAPAKQRLSRASRFLAVWPDRRFSTLQLCLRAETSPRHLSAIRSHFIERGSLQGDLQRCELPSRRRLGIGLGCLSDKNFDRLGSRSGRSRSPNGAGRRRICRRPLMGCCVDRIRSMLKYGQAMRSLDERLWSLAEPDRETIDLCTAQWLA
jgi:hypothetical protein